MTDKRNKYSGIQEDSLASIYGEYEKEIWIPTRRVKTGWPELDNFLRDSGMPSGTGGIVYPSYINVHAQPKVGKTTWAQEVSRRWVEQGGWAIVLDLENGRRRYIKRLVQRMSDLKDADMKRGLTKQQKARKEKTQKWFTDGPGCRMILKNDRIVTVEKAIKWVREVKDLAKKKDNEYDEEKDSPIIFVIDSLQKLPMGGEKRAGIDAWLRIIEEMRDVEEICIMTISEVHRPKGTSKEYSAHATAAKESGDIEYTVDLGIGLQKCKSGNPNATKESWLDVHWNRDGETGRVCKYRLDYPNMIEIPLDRHSNKDND